MRWVSYTRATSCIEDDMPSDIIKQQNKTIDDFMKRNGWTVEKKYSDRRHSKEEVSAFEQMVQDGMQREFDGVVVSSIFRCGRNQNRAKEILMETFFPAGIHFAVAGDQFCSIGKTENEINEYFDNIQRACYEKRMQASVGLQARQGRIPFQMRQYGYIVSEDHSRFMVDEEGAGVVRFIFQKFLNGESYTEIAKELNEKGLLTPQEHIPEARGRKSKTVRPSKWEGVTVKRILSCSVYTGKKHCKVDDSEIDYDVPVIIQKETFDAAQKKIEQINKLYKNRGKNLTRNTGVSYLAGFIYDKRTGLRMKKVNNLMLNGERCFLPGSNFCTQKMRDRLVSEKDITNAVKQCLKDASRQVIYIDHLMEIGEGKRQAELEISLYRDQAKSIVSKMDQLCLSRMEMHYEYQNGDIGQEEFEEKEEEYQRKFLDFEEDFQKITSEIKSIEKAYSCMNPWLVCYRDMHMPAQLDRDFMKKWIDRVLIDDAKHIEVVLKNKKWMTMLPNKWLKEGAESV